MYSSAANCRGILTHAPSQCVRWERGTHMPITVSRVAVYTFQYVGWPWKFRNGVSWRRRINVVSLFRLCVRALMSQHVSQHLLKIDRYKSWWCVLRRRHITFGGNVEVETIDVLAHIQRMLCRKLGYSCCRWFLFFSAHANWYIELLVFNWRNKNAVSQRTKCTLYSLLLTVEVCHLI